MRNRPRLPNVQIAGHSPAILFAPGSITDASIRPPVKQNLFHVVSIPPSNSRPCVLFRDNVTSSFPPLVVTAPGSYHSMLLVWWIYFSRVHIGKKKNIPPSNGDQPLPNTDHHQDRRNGHQYWIRHWKQAGGSSWDRCRISLCMHFGGCLNQSDLYYLASLEP